MNIVMLKNFSRAKHCTTWSMFIVVIHCCWLLYGRDEKKRVHKSSSPTLVAFFPLFNSLSRTQASNVMQLECKLRRVMMRTDGIDFVYIGSLIWDYRSLFMHFEEGRKINFTKERVTFMGCSWGDENAHIYFVAHTNIIYMEVEA